MLGASVALGRQVAALLDSETPVPGVTGGDIRPELRPIGAIARYVTDMARRIAALLALRGELDANYRRVTREE